VWGLPTVGEVNPATIFKVVENFQPAAINKACEATSKESDEELLLPPGNVTKIGIPLAFPVPVTWINYFLVGCTPRQTYRYIAMQTKEWSKLDGGKTAAKQAMLFARALLTKAKEADMDLEGSSSIIQLPDWHHRANSWSGQADAPGLWYNHESPLHRLTPWTNRGRQKHQVQQTN
jgi:hypothetical protein